MAEFAAAGCLAIAALCALWLVLAVRSQRRGRERLAGWAAANGWRLTWNPPVDWGRRMPGGSRDGVTHSLSAVVGGRPVTVAEYVVSGPHGSAFHTIVAVTLSRPLPFAEVTPRVFAASPKVAGPDGPAVLAPALEQARRQRLVPDNWTVRGTELLTHHPGRLAVAEIQSLSRPMLTLAQMLDPL